MLLLCAPDGRELLVRCGYKCVSPEYMSSFGEIKLRKFPIGDKGGKTETHALFIWSPGAVFRENWLEYIQSTRFDLRPLIFTSAENVEVSIFLERIRGGDIKSLGTLVNFLRLRWLQAARSCSFWLDTDIAQYKEMVQKRFPKIRFPDSPNTLVSYVDQVDKIIDAMACLESECLIGGFRVGYLGGKHFSFQPPEEKILSKCKEYVKSFASTMRCVLHSVERSKFDAFRIANALVRITEDRQCIEDPSRPGFMLHMLSLRWTIRKLFIPIFVKFNKPKSPLEVHDLIRGFEIHLRPRVPYVDPMVLLSCLCDTHVSFGSQFSAKRCQCNLLTDPGPAHQCPYGRNGDKVIAKHKLDKAAAENIKRLKREATIPSKIYKKEKVVVTKSKFVYVAKPLR